MPTKVIQERWFAAAPNRRMNPDGVYGLQCVDAADDYAEYIFGVPWETSVGGVNGANGLPDRMPDEYWTRIDNDPNKPDQLPERGDVIVWAGLGAGSANPFGHVAIVLSADTTGVQVIQQDGFTPPLAFVNGAWYSDKPATITRLAYWNAGTGMVSAWLRPKPHKVAGADAAAPVAPARTTAYEFITSWDFPGHTKGANCPAVFGQGAREILADVVHWWGDPANRPTFDSTCRYLAGQSGAGVSSHYVAEAGRIACGVNEVDASHANGNAWANVKTVTWECNPRCSDGDYETVAEGISDAWVARGYTTPGMIFGHNRYFNTQCPGNYDLARLRTMTNAKFLAKKSGATRPNPVVPKPVPIQPPVPAPVPKPAPAITGYVPDPHWVVEDGEYLGQIAAWANTTPERLAAYNGIANPDRIKVGDWVWPPTGWGTWHVRPGETLTSIQNYFRAHGHKAITADRIANANGINNPSRELTVGRRLQIPK